MTTDPRAPEDYRRAWIDLAELVRKFNTEEEDFKGLLRTMLYLPIPDDLRTALIETTGDALVAAAYFPETVREGWANKMALILSGQPEFDVPRFLHHATSDDPDGKWSYQLAHPEEGEWSRDPADPTSCTKIDIEPV